MAKGKKWRKRKKKWKGENGVSGKKRGKINSFYFHFASPGGGWLWYKCEVVNVWANYNNFGRYVPLPWHIDNSRWRGSVTVYLPIVIFLLGKMFSYYTPWSPPNSLKMLLQYSFWSRTCPAVSLYWFFYLLFSMPLLFLTNNNFWSFLSD